MSEYEFTPTRIFPYRDRIVNSVIIRENRGQRKTCVLVYFTQCNIQHYFFFKFINIQKKTTPDAWPGSPQTSKIESFATAVNSV